MFTGAALLGSTHVWDEEAGQFVSAEIQRVAEVINDWNPDLRLVYIPQNERTVEDGGKCFGVAHFPDGKQPYLVMFCDESEVNHTLIARLWNMDQTRMDVVQYLDTVNAAAEAVELKRKMEAEAEMHDQALHVLKSPLNKYRLDKNRVFTS